MCFKAIYTYLMITSNRLFEIWSGSTAETYCDDDDDDDGNNNGPRSFRKTSHECNNNMYLLPTYRLYALNNIIFT